MSELTIAGHDLNICQQFSLRAQLDQIIGNIAGIKIKCTHQFQCVTACVWKKLEGKELYFHARVVLSCLHVENQARLFLSLMNCSFLRNRTP